MSEQINNREYRQQVLKDLISQLHAGKSVEEVKRQFEKTFDGVSASEISDVEQALIAQGLPVSEVQRLCDVHAAVFKGSIEQIHQTDRRQPSGHPMEVFKAENRALEALIDGRILPHLEAWKNHPEQMDKTAMAADLDRLSQVDRHYLKKENLLFPYMERYGITAPPKVMWGVDDEIRGAIRSARDSLTQGQDPLPVVEAAVNQIREMIFKEENIMLPMLSDVLTQDEWKKIAAESGEFGYCLLDDAPEWNPASENPAETTAAVPQAESGAIVLPTGKLSLEELTALLNTLPFDVTFVDQDDTVAYFSQGSDRIFARTKAVIGRKVTNCHPPASVHIVEKIVADFKSGCKDHEDFWIKMGPRYVFIRYFAVRDPRGTYLGTLEVTQDIGPIQQITGEKRLASQ